MSDTITLPETGTHVRKPSPARRVKESATLPPLSGRYEVLIPNRNETIFFTDSLHEVAGHVALARWGNTDKAEEVLAFLAAVEQRGYLAANTYGVRVHRPLPDGRPWTARVRGAQQRPLPAYAIGDYVEATGIGPELPAYLKPGRVLRIYGVMALNDRRPGRQYSYLVGGGGGTRVREDGLRPATAHPGELDFAAESA